MTRAWIEHANVELTPGHPDGTPSMLEDVRIAIEGGFVHVEVPGSELTLVFSAPGIRRIIYPASGRSCAV